MFAFLNRDIHATLIILHLHSLYFRQLVISLSFLHFIYFIFITYTQPSPPNQFPSLSPSLSLSLSLLTSPNPCRSVATSAVTPQLISDKMATQDPQTQTFHWRYDELDDKNFQIRGRTLFFIIVLFSVILLITLLFLYARWICRSSSSSSAAVADTATLSPHVQAFSRPQGLDSAVIDSLPITLHHRLSTSSATGSESECCICLGVFEEGEKVKVLPKCCHAYHCECVDKWLTSHSSCPICRAALLVDSPV